MKHLHNSRNKERDFLIRQLVLDGMTYKDIGRQVGLTGQRVKQLIDGYGWERPGDVRRRKRTEKLEKERKDKWGEGDLNLMRQDDFYAATRRKFLGKKANATRSGIPFDLNYGDLHFPLYCPMLKTKLNYFSDKISNDSPSFDRIDPSKGYTKENTIVVSFLANKIKTDATPDQIYKVWRYLQDVAESQQKADN